MIWEQLYYWHWLIIGVVLIIFEVFVPGAMLMWLGIAAGVVGVIVYYVQDMVWEYQVLIFSVLSVVSIIVWRRFFHGDPADTDQPNLNRRGEQYVGRTFTLEEPIVDCVGKMRVLDSTWKVSCLVDYPAGTKVTVTEVDGVVLCVTAIPDLPE